MKRDKSMEGYVSYLFLAAIYFPFNTQGLDLEEYVHKKTKLNEKNEKGRRIRN